MSDNIIKDLQIQIDKLSSKIQELEGGSSAANGRTCATPVNGYTCAAPANGHTCATPAYGHSGYVTHCTPCAPTPCATPCATPASYTCAPCAPCVTCNVNGTCAVSGPYTGDLCAVSAAYTCAPCAPCITCDANFKCAVNPTSSLDGGKQCAVSQQSTCWVANCATPPYQFHCAVPACQVSTPWLSGPNPQATGQIDGPPEQPHVAAQPGFTCALPWQGQQLCGLPWTGNQQCAVVPPICLCTITMSAVSNTTAANPDDA